MTEKEISIKYNEYNTQSELSTEHRELLSEAADACKNAYSPYSGFKVGAAIRCGDGKIVKGNNQENAAYPSGLCAERVALFTASAQNPGVVIKAIAITTESSSNSDIPVSPCGACRQVMAEYENRQGSEIEILFSSNTGRVFKVNGVKSLLPFTFNSNHLPDNGSH